MIRAKVSSYLTCNYGSLNHSYSAFLLNCSYLLQYGLAVIVGAPNLHTMRTILYKFCRKDSDLDIIEQITCFFLIDKENKSKKMKYR